MQQIQNWYFWVVLQAGTLAELWSKVKAKATLERKTMREVIFESLKWYITPAETAAGSDKKKKAKKSKG